MPESREAVQELTPWQFRLARLGEPFDCPWGDWPADARTVRFVEVDAGVASGRWLVAEVGRVLRLVEGQGRVIGAPVASSDVPAKAEIMEGAGR